MTRRRTRSDELITETKLPALITTEVGWLVQGSSAANPLIDFAGNTLGPLAARTTVAFDAAAIDRALATRQGVVLHFERGRPELPIIVGLIVGKESPLLELLLDAPRAGSDRAGGASKTQAAPPRNATPTAPAVAAMPTASTASMAPAMPAAPVAPAGPSLPVEAKLDGQRVVLDAENEIVLRCGEASITLTRNGKILLRGAYVETHSRGVNRIKGGSVKIN